MDRTGDQEPAGVEDPRAPGPIAVIAGDAALSAALGDALGILGHDVEEAGLEELPEGISSRARTLVIVPDREARGVEPSDLGHRLRRTLDHRDGRRVVFVSSAAVYEPNNHHPGFSTEEQLLPLRFRNPLSARWRALEEAAAEADRRRSRTVVLRPPPVPVPDGSDLVSRLFRRRWAVVLPGRDPTIQLLAVEDLARAVSRAASSDRVGVFNLAPRSGVPLRRALRAAGVTPVPVPRWLQGFGRRLLRVASPDVAPIRRLDFIRHSWTVSAEKARDELGFEPERSSLEVLAGSGTDENFDDYGLDRRYVETWCRTVLRFFRDVYWRAEVRGLEHVPPDGPVVLVGVHRGWVPVDAVLVVCDVLRTTDRIPRFLIHPGLLRAPFFSDFVIKFGGVLACRENADRVLGRGGILGVFPEGVRGPFRLYRDAYRLGRFGSDEFLRAALRHGAPIVPFVTVGSAEAFPIVAKIESRWWRRNAEWPFIPVSPTLLPIPLPSKWHTRFLPPLSGTGALGRSAADDPETIRSLRRRVREILASEMASIRRRRPGIFHGSVFGETSSGEE